MKKLLFVFLFLLVVGALGYMYKNGVTSVENINNVFHFTAASSHQPSLTIRNQTFFLSLAKTQQEQVAGLSNKPSLPQDNGMLFLFTKADRYTFWMKDMQFPLDILFLRNNKIVAIFQNLPPPSVGSLNIATVTPREDADMVLEINAGLSRKYGFKVGDPVQILL